MKMPKSLLLTLTFLFLSSTAQAQFWKKLKDRAKDAAEETVFRKVEEKATEKTESTIDSIFELPNQGKKNTDPNSESSDEYEEVNMDTEVNDENIIEEYLNQQKEEEVSLAESYDFEWKYVLQMESAAQKKKKEMGDMKVTYFLNPQSTTFATQFDMDTKKMAAGNTLMVMDMSAGVNFMLMEMEGEKIIQKMPSMAKIMNEEADDYMDTMTINKIGTKEILGYTCQGFEILLEEGTSTVYINPNAPVSFNHSGNPKYAPKSFKQEWLKEYQNGLMMEMTFVSNKKAKHNMKMTCVELAKEPFTVNISEYKSFMEMGRE